MRFPVAIIGAGFAGSEAAWQLARRGIGVDLYEMRPQRSTEAHKSSDFAELVCSNSFKSTRLENAHGLLKAELTLQGSLVLAAAEQARLPAGQALAVDRQVFSAWLTRRLSTHPLVRVWRQEISEPESLLGSYRHVIVASGPLTSPALAAALSRRVGGDFLYFYDAITPLIAADSIDETVVYRASRYGKSHGKSQSTQEGRSAPGAQGAPEGGTENGTADYLNCPLDQEQYERFVAELLEAEKVAFHDFEALRHFEGCLPIEVMAERGLKTLAFGPMKPVGLIDPRTGKIPYAVVQLRQENLQASLYGMVGFQTKMTWPEQRRIFRSLPGLQSAEFARLGSLHRNTFLESPRLLDEELALRGEPRIFFAGQITGVEGYVESCATGLYAAQRVALRLRGERGKMPPSGKTLCGALVRYVTSSPLGRFQPMNAAFGLLDPAPAKLRKKERRTFYAQRALAETERLSAADAALEPPVR